MYKLKIVGDCGEELHGTSVTFFPARAISERIEYDFDKLKQLIRSRGEEMISQVELAINIDLDDY